MIAPPVACHVANVDLPARCGTLTVREKAGASRTIATYYVVFPAAGRNAGAVFLPFGGPGESAAAGAAALLGSDPEPSVVALHAHHDLVFADQRGTGKSHPLQCPQLYASLRESFAEIYPSARLRECRAKLAADADLTAYGTTASVDDLDALRKALGYPKISLDTGSYGSQLAFEYLRRYPASLRAVLLQGVVPPDAKAPLGFTRAAQHALDGLEAACAADETCRSAYPNFGTEWNAVAARFRDGPQTVPLSGGDGATAPLSDEVFADSIRHVLYSPFLASSLPAAIHAAAQNDYGPVAALTKFEIEGFRDDIAFGEFLSVTCAEDVEQITPGEEATAARDGFLGNLRIEAQRRACAIWNVPPAPRAFLAPVHSTVPVLMISGADDPAAPSWMGASQLPNLPNGRQIIVPGGGHNNDDPCLAKLRVAFIEDPEPRKLDASCASQHKRPPFVTDFAAWSAQAL